MSNPKYFFHIGFPKTGSTYLQKSIFPQFKDTSFFGRSMNIKKNIDKYNFQKNILISDESIGGGAFEGNWAEQFYENMLKLKNMYPNGAIILCVREQTDLISSIYNQYIQQGGTYSFKKLWNSSIFKLHDFLFKYRINVIRSIFSDLLIIDYDQLLLEPLNVFNRLIYFMGIDCNVNDLNINTGKFNESLGIIQGSVLRKINSLDYLLQRTPLIPSLRNRLFKKMKISPRYICQKRLKFLDSRKFDCSVHLKDKELKSLNDDWKWTLKFIENYRTNGSFES